MKQTAILIALIALAASGVAQVNVQLRGQGENLAGKTVELYCYDDMLTLAERRLDECVADSNGAFELACYLTYPRLVFVQVELYSQSFYAEPGRTYQIFLPHFRWEQDEERNVFLDPVALPLEFLDLPDDELNLRILRFDSTVDAYLSAHRVHFDPRYKPNRTWMDSLEAACRPEGLDSNSYFARYVDYSLAEMRYAMRFASRGRMWERHVEGKTLLYHDENYMRMLLTLADGMISKGTRKLPKWKIAEWVGEANLPVYLDSIGTDPLLRDEQLRELAALVALKESFYDADYSRDGVRQLVRQLGEQTKWEQHRALAQRLLELFDRANEGSEPLRDVVLPDVDHRPVGLDSLQGKWLYISFVRANDANCQRELETMAHFRDTVYSQGDVEFISIDCDREFQKMYHLLRNNRRGNNYHWLWLHFDGDYHLLERLGVVAFPTFLLVDPQGNRVYDYTPAPESGFLLHAPWQRKDAKKQ